MFPSNSAWIGFLAVIALFGATVAAMAIYTAPWLWALVKPMIRAAVA